MKLETVIKFAPVVPVSLFALFVINFLPEKLNFDLAPLKEFFIHYSVKETKKRKINITWDGLELTSYHSRDS